VIGRDPEHADLALDDSSLEPEHAFVFYDAALGQFFLKDNASFAGTFVQCGGGPLELNEADATYLRFGRTTASLRLYRGRPPHGLDT